MWIVSYCLYTSFLFGVWLGMAHPAKCMPGTSGRAEPFAEFSCVENAGEGGTGREEMGS